MKRGLFLPAGTSRRKYEDQGSTAWAAAMTGSSLEEPALFMYAQPASASNRKRQYTFASVSWIASKLTSIAWRSTRLSRDLLPVARRQATEQVILDVLITVLQRSMREIDVINTFSSPTRPVRQR
jgi:hypothetical protein